MRLTSIAFGTVNSDWIVSLAIQTLQFPT